MSIKSTTAVAAVRPPPPPPPVRTAAKEAPEPATVITQGPDVVELSARAQQAYEASQRGGDHDHDGD